MEGPKVLAERSQKNQCFLGYQLATAAASASAWIGRQSRRLLRTDDGGLGEGLHWQLCRGTLCARRFCLDVGRHLRAVVAHSQSGAARTGERTGGIGAAPADAPAELSCHSSEKPWRS